MDVEAAKRAAGEAAVQLIDDGVRVGLGTGSTVRWFILALAERVRAGLRIRGVATSHASETLARDLSIPLETLSAEPLDIAVDGADVVDSELQLLKGGGGALVREKIVACAARRFVVVVDDTKLHAHLDAPVPVELLPFGVEHTLRLLEGTGGRFTVRTSPEGATLYTDNGNLLADGDYGRIDDPASLAQRIDGVPGVVGHGIFVGLTSLALVGHDDGSVTRLTESRVHLPAGG